jgi:hypothetical protein
MWSIHGMISSNSLTGWQSGYPTHHYNIHEPGHIDHYGSPNPWLWSTWSTMQVTLLYTCVPRYTNLTRAWYAIRSRQYSFKYSSMKKTYDIYLSWTVIKCFDDVIYPASRKAKTEEHWFCWCLEGINLAINLYVTLRLPNAMWQIGGYLVNLKMNSYLGVFFIVSSH